MKKIDKFINKLKRQYCRFWINDIKERRKYRFLLEAEEKYKGEGYSHYGNKLIHQGQDAVDVIYDELSKGKPCLITRFGRTEITTIGHYYNCRHLDNPIFPNYIKQYMKTCSGFFNTTDYYLTRFSMESLDMIKNIDVLGAWNFINDDEKNMMIEYGQNARLVTLWSISNNTCMAKRPWTRYLKGKKVLVVHPFVETIKKQYEKRELLFKNPDMLPEFELKTVKAVQGLCESKEVNQYDNWFEALKYMEDEIDKVDYDIALIGAGAYGMFLGNHVKKMGKQAVHVGGALQLFFGIKGGRWEQDENTLNHVNLEHWVRPSEEETPKDTTSFEKDEGARAYW